MTVLPLGRIWPRSGKGSLSGQYMIQGDKGSREIFRTLPPALRVCPEGVRRGYDGDGGFDAGDIEGMGG